MSGLGKPASVRSSGRTLPSPIWITVVPLNRIWVSKWSTVSVRIYNCFSVFSAVCSLQFYVMQTSAGLLYDQMPMLPPVIGVTRWSFSFLYSLSPYQRDVVPLTLAVFLSSQVVNGTLIVPVLVHRYLCSVADGWLLLCCCRWRQQFWKRCRRSRNASHRYLPSWRRSVRTKLLTTRLSRVDQMLQEQLTTMPPLSLPNQLQWWVTSRCSVIKHSLRTVHILTGMTEMAAVIFYFQEKISASIIIQFYWFHFQFSNSFTYSFMSPCDATFLGVFSVIHV